MVRHTSVKKVLLGIAILIVFTFAFFAIGLLQHIERVEIVEREEGRHWKPLVPNWKWIEGSAFTNLCEKSDLVVDAYSNSNVKKVRHAFSNLVEWCVGVAPEQYTKILVPVFNVLNISFLRQSIDDNTSSVAEFVEFIKLNREMVLFLGYADAKRGYYTEKVFNLEYRYLERLYDYRSFFGKHNKKDFCDAVEKFIDDCIEEIDSPGIVYNYIHWDFRLNLHLASQGVMSRKEAVRVSRYNVTPFERLMGRPPKWIDEIK